jgi:hypothetical protein
MDLNKKTGEEKSDPAGIGGAIAGGVAAGKVLREKGVGQGWRSAQDAPQISNPFPTREEDGLAPVDQLQNPVAAKPAAAAKSGVAGKVAIAAVSFGVGAAGMLGYHQSRQGSVQSVSSARQEVYADASQAQGRSSERSEASPSGALGAAGGGHLARLESIARGAGDASSAGASLENTAGAASGQSGGVSPGGGAGQYSGAGGGSGVSNPGGVNDPGNLQAKVNRTMQGAVNQGQGLGRRASQGFSGGRRTQGVTGSSGGGGGSGGSSSKVKLQKMERTFSAASGPGETTADTHNQQWDGGDKGRKMLPAAESSGRNFSPAASNPNGRSYAPARHNSGGDYYGGFRAGQNASNADRYGSRGLQGSNVTPYQGMIDLAQALMGLASTLLGLASLLGLIAKKGPTDFMTKAMLYKIAKMLAYAAMAVSIMLTGVGAMIMMQTGQVSQGGLFMGVGIALTILSYVAAEGFGDAEKEAINAAENAKPKELTPESPETSNSEEFADDGAELADGEPADTKPADAKPADTKQADAKPADTKQADAKPADVKSSDIKPADIQMTEPQTVEAGHSIEPEQVTKNNPFGRPATEMAPDNKLWNMGPEAKGPEAAFARMDSGITGHVQIRDVDGIRYINHNGEVFWRPVP